MIIIKRAYTLRKNIRLAWSSMQLNAQISPYLYLNYMKYVRWYNYLMCRIPIFFYAQNENDEILMIAPMAYDFRFRQYLTLGDVAMCDITDFLFQNGIPQRRKKELLDALCVEIGCDFYLNRIWTGSETLAALGNRILLCGIHHCVNIELNEEYESNISRLSSSVRQNIRTAYNRMKRDEQKYELVVHYGDMKDSKSLYNDIVKCYVKRQLTSYSEGRSKFGILLHHWTTRYLRHDNSSLFHNDNAIQVALYLNGQIASMFAGIINEKEDRILIPRLAIDLDFKFYSPGYVMLCEAIKYFLQFTTIRNIDLCRGTERYKIDMGGTIYETGYYKVLV